MTLAFKNFSYCKILSGKLERILWIFNIFDFISLQVPAKLLRVFSMDAITRIVWNSGKLRPINIFRVRNRRSIRSIATQAKLDFKLLQCGAEQLLGVSSISGGKQETMIIEVGERDEDTHDTWHMTHDTCDSDTHECNLLYFQDVPIAHLKLANGSPGTQNIKIIICFSRIAKATQHEFCFLPWQCLCHNVSIKWNGFPTIGCNQTYMFNLETIQQSIEPIDKVCSLPQAI